MTDSTPKRSFLERDLKIGLITTVLGALLGVLGTLWVEKRKEPKELADAAADSTHRTVIVARADTTNARLGETLGKLGMIFNELVKHSGQITTQTDSFTATLTELSAAIRQPTIDTSYVTRLVGGLKGQVREFERTSKEVNSGLEQSKALVSLYESHAKNDGDLNRLILPRKQLAIRAMPIDNKYFVGVKGEYLSQNQVCVYGNIDGRQRDMCSGDTAMIIRGKDRIKVTFESVDETSYIFAVSHF